MFGVITDPTQNLILFVFFVLWAALLFGGFLFGKPNAEGTCRMPVWTRIASSVVLVGAAWDWRSITATAQPGVQNYSTAIAIGMTLGLVGDLFMNVVSKFVPEKTYVMGGIAAFGLGHVAYIQAILAYSDQYNLNAPLFRFGAWGVWLLIAVVLWYIIVYRPQEKHSFLHYAALLYALLLASTTGLATGLALQARSFIPLAVGAGIFLLSDLILAGQLFSKLQFRLIKDVIWLTYGPGQLLIVYSVWSALRVVG